MPPVSLDALQGLSGACLLDRRHCLFILGAKPTSIFSLTYWAESSSMSTCFSFNSLLFLFALKSWTWWVFTFYFF